MNEMLPQQGMIPQKFSTQAGVVHLWQYFVALGWFCQSKVKIQFWNCFY